MNILVYKRLLLYIISINFLHELVIILFFKLIIPKDISSGLGFILTIKISLLSSSFTYNSVTYPIPYPSFIKSINRFELAIFILGSIL